MTELSIDIETYSSVDLTKTGVRPYVESPDFRLLLIGYKLGEQPTRLIDLGEEESQKALTLMPPEPSSIPEGSLKEFTELLTDPDIIKTAHNASFERTCLAKAFGLELPPEQWRCTMVQAATLGLPSALAEVGAALGLEKQKLTEGKELIRYFCKSAPDGHRRLPSEAPEKWERFRQYNVRDVDVEADIKGRLARFPRPQAEHDAWALDQRINDRGIRIDTGLLEKALELDKQYSAQLRAEAKRVTGLDNPRSDAQLKRWLAERGIETDSLDKEALPALLESAPDAITRRALQLRQEMGKTSVKKYEAKPMRTGPTKQEKTTEIYFDEKDPTIFIRTHNTDLKNRLTAYSRKHPAVCKLTDVDPDTGCKEFEIEKGRFSFRLTAAYREERRRAASEAAKNE